MKSPIETYLHRLTEKLLARFDRETVTLTLNEVKSHLHDCVDELKEEGVPPVDAERIAIERFDAPGKARFLFVLASRNGEGDRAWAMAAYVFATLAGLGLAAYGLIQTKGTSFDPVAFGPVFAALLFVYGILCARAKKFVMLWPTAATLMVITALSSILKPDISTIEENYTRFRGSGALLADVMGERAKPAPHNFRPPGTSGELARDLGGPTKIEIADVEAGNLGRVQWRRGVRGGLGAPQGHLSPTWSEIESLRVEDLNIPLDGGMTSLHGPPWLMLLRGIIPDVARLGLLWLLFAFMTNAMVWWVGCLERHGSETSLVQ